MSRNQYGFQIVPFYRDFKVIMSHHSFFIKIIGAPTGDLECQMKPLSRCSSMFPEEHLIPVQRGHRWVQTVGRFQRWGRWNNHIFDLSVAYPHSIFEYYGEVTILSRSDTGEWSHQMMCRWVASLEYAPVCLCTYPYKYAK